VAGDDLHFLCDQDGFVFLDYARQLETLSAGFVSSLETAISTFHCQHLFRCGKYSGAK
jgi:hypothetical protein